MNRTTLHNYFKGTATEREERLILDWVEASEENKKILQKERMLYDITLFHDTAKKERIHKKNIRSFSIAKWAVRVAAAVIVILSGRTLIREYQYAQDVQMQTVTVPAGKRAELTLADGTRVWLNAQSTLTYSADFGRKERNVELDGEAYFEVISNTKIPFFVHTESNKVGVVGTSFSVTAYKGSNEFETVLVEGIVDIYTGDSEKAITRLTKDEMFSCKQDKSQKRKIKSHDSLGWKDGLYYFDDASFEDILKKLEKYYKVKFVIVNPELLNYHITGKFREQDGVEHILRSIQKDHKFNYTIDTNTNVITIN